jgi:hypothetical protein
VKLTTVAVFGVGYVLGTRAGRERYAQIVAAAQRASQRLDAYSKGGSRPSYRDRPAGSTESAARSD